MNFHGGPEGKSSLTRQINTNHSYRVDLHNHDHGEYLDHKHKWQMTAPDRQLWSHPERKAIWYPSSNQQPKATLPFGALSPLCSYPDSDYDQRLRGLKQGHNEANKYTHQSTAAAVGAVGELSTYDEDGDGVIDAEEMAKMQLASASLATSVILDRLPVRIKSQSTVHSTIL